MHVFNSYAVEVSLPIFKVPEKTIAHAFHTGQVTRAILLRFSERFSALDNVNNKLCKSIVGINHHYIQHYNPLFLYQSK